MLEREREKFTAEFHNVSDTVTEPLLEMLAHLKTDDQQIIEFVLQLVEALPTRRE